MGTPLGLFKISFFPRGLGLAGEGDGGGTSPDAIRHPPCPCLPRVGNETQYTHHGHKRGVHDALATRTERGKGQTEGCYVPPSGAKTLQVDIPGPNCRRWGGVPQRRSGMTAWTHVANGEHSVWTRHGAVKHGKSGGSVGTTRGGKGKGSREGRIGREEGQRAVRGPWAPPPMEEEGPRDGQ